jgi:hypothetical protein
MKTKILKSAVVAATLSMMAGCIVLSVYPFYTPKDVVFEPGLTGQWADGGKTNETWEFSDLDGKSYLLTTRDEHDTNVFEATLFQLKRYEFLDLLATNRGEFEMPLHLIAKVAHPDTNWSVQFMDFGWLAKLLETNPAVLRHIVVPMEAGKTNSSMIYLTAETMDLQKFLLKHAEDTNVFGSDSAIVLERLSR